MGTKLYLLKARKDFTGYINNQNIVVRATSEAQARTLATMNDTGANWIESYATCEELNPVGEIGVIITDNNGG